MAVLYIIMVLPFMLFNSKLKNHSTLFLVSYLFLKHNYYFYVLLLRIQ